MELFGTQQREHPEVQKWWQEGGSDPPPTRAGGQDDGSLPKLPQMTKGTPEKTKNESPQPEFSWFENENERLRKNRSLVI